MYVAQTCYSVCAHTYGNTEQQRCLSYQRCTHVRCDTAARGISICAWTACTQYRCCIACVDDGAAQGAAEHCEHPRSAVSTQHSEPQHCTLAPTSESALFNVTRSHDVLSVVCTALCIHCSCSIIAMRLHSACNDCCNECNLSILQHTLATQLTRQAFAAYGVRRCSHHSLEL